MEQIISLQGIEGDPGSEANAGTDLDSDPGDEQYESIESLLSGPKDSVTMFGSAACRRERFQLDMHAGADPLDVLAKEVQARSSRQKLHQELDMFLNDAVQHAGASAASAASCVQEGVAAREEETCELERRLQEATRRLEDDRVTMERLSKEADMYKNRAEGIERAFCDAMRAQKELEADVAAANRQVFDLRRQLDVDHEARQAMETMEQLLVSHEREAEDMKRKLAFQEQASAAERLELAQLRGDRDALQRTSAEDLGKIASVLAKSLLRTQREQLRKFESRADEQLCLACLSEKKNVVLRPCNHLTMCENCFTQCSQICPQCRALVQGHLVIYS